MTGILVAWCRRYHRGEYLTPSVVGGGSLRCVRCRTGFTDMADGGALCLSESERTLSWESYAFVTAAIKRQEAAALDSGSYRLYVKGELVKAGRIGETEDAEAVSA